MDVIQHAYNMQEFFVRFGFLGVFAISLFFTPVRQGDFRVFGFFIVYLLISSMVTGFGLEARRVILNVGLALLFYKVVTEHLKTDTLKIFAWWVLATILLNVVLMIYQGFNNDLLFTRVNNVDVPFNEKAVGFFKLKVNVGVFGAMAGVLLALINPFFSLLAIPFMWIGESSTSIVAFLVSMGTILYFRVRKAIFYIALAIILSLGSIYVLKVDLPGGQFGERFKVWNESLSLVLRVNPVIGVGAGTFSKVDFQTNQETVQEKLYWSWAHNEYLQIFFETGIIGLSIVLLFLYRQFKDFLEFSNDPTVQVLFASFLCVAIISICHFPFHVGKFSGFCVFIMALFHARIRECQKLNH